MHSFSNIKQLRIVLNVNFLVVLVKINRKNINQPEISYRCHKYYIYVFVLVQKAEINANITDKLGTYMLYINLIYFDT